VDDVLSFASGLLEASGLDLHAFGKVSELNQIIQDAKAVLRDASELSPRTWTGYREAWAEGIAAPPKR